ncbi:MAG: iron-containing redox enzyme family protein [Bacteriovorax sp.]|jgi:hypothetical protein
MSKKLEMALMKELDISSEFILDCDWKSKEFYADYMAQTFYYVRHSTRLLALCASRLNYEQEQKIHLRFIRHLGEESNHEKLALNDISRLDFSVDDFPELCSTRLFYEPQYYKIEHERPLALMGYILFLEALAQKVCPPLAKTISSCHGSKAGTFFHVHGEEDPAHVGEALKMINVLSPPDLAAIEHNLVQSSYAYILMVNELKLKWASKNKKRAA